MVNNIDHNSTKTPFTNQDIPRVNSFQWKHLDISQLENERYKLQQRLNMAYTLNNASIINCITQGIQQINEIINQKMRQ